MQLAFPELSAGLQVVTAGGLEPLFERLATRLESDPLPPFERELIVLGDHAGLSSWLELRLADRLGCAAGIDFIAPRGLADWLARRHLPEEPSVVARRTGRDPFEPESLAWRIESLLAAWPDGDPLMTPLRAYLDRSGTGRVALASRIARLFSDYQTYRPDLLAAWRRGANPVADWAPSRWQAALWQRLCEEARGPHGEPVVDRATELERLRQWIADQHSAPEAFPRRLSIFGVLVIPPPFIQLFREIARLAPVTWYAVTPHPAEGPLHPLARLLASQTAEFSELIPGEPQRVTVTHPPADRALRVVQDDIRERRHRRPDDRVTLDPADPSLRIHDCHGAVRELEVLRDQLLDAFETIEGLRPDDVAIFITDVERYAPLVEAVFGDSGETPAIPYHIVGNPRSPARRLLEAFGSLLELPGGRLAASEVLDLLDEPAIRRKAGIEEAELATLREWVRRANIRWGEDGPHKASFNLPADDLHTWRHGLDRLMMGYAMGEVDAPVLGIVPLGEPLLDRADLLGRFADWLDRLLATTADLRRPRTLGAWAESVSTLITSYLEPDEEEETTAVRFLLDRAAALRDFDAMLPHRGEVAYAEVRSHLAQRLSMFGGDRRTITGRVTVADFQHLRNAPFRVIAAVGLNDGAFPRSADLPNYDVRTRERRPGDHDPRSLDRQLFLDALLAASDRFIITYTGRSQKDNTVRAASVVLDALLETCRQTFTSADAGPSEDAGAVLRHFVVRHALQPFSPRYFDGRDTRLFSYDERLCLQPIAEREPSSPFAPERIQPPEPDAVLDITLRELIEAWVNPSKYFCGRFGIYFGLEDLTLQDLEPIRLDHLESYGVRDRLLELILGGMGDDEARARLLRTGSLPGGALGESWFRQLRGEVEEIARLVQRYGAGVPLDCEVTAPAWRLTGRAEYVVGETALLFRCASVKAKDQLRAWFTHLALNADPRTQAGGIETVVIGTSGAYRFRVPDDAAAVLAPVVEAVRELRTSPAPLFPLASAAFAEKGSWSAARSAFINGFSQHDFEEAHIRLCFRHSDPTREEDPDFERWATTLWQPLIEHRTEER